MNLSFKAIVVLRILTSTIVYGVFQSFLSNLNDKALFLCVLVMLTIMGCEVDRIKPKTIRDKPVEDKYKNLTYTELKWIGIELERNLQQIQIKGSYYFVVCVFLIFTWVQGFWEVGIEGNVVLCVVIPVSLILLLAILIIRIYIHQRQLDRETSLIERLTTKREIKRRLNAKEN